ncbi:glycosyltransferase family 4 protein [Pseudomonas fluvialis]|uniref:glycosyltransferase family 4 protein n=1 Tax=Pseudomonas fluvialis TaxID=1793966 RepID=UPI00370B68B5
MNKSLLFVVNDPAFFVSHRLALALAAKSAGYEVYVATMPGEAVAVIKDAGLSHFVLALTRSGRNPFAELLSFLDVFNLFKKIRPDIVHLVTIKPVIYGGIAGRLAGVRGVVCAISGLGFVFIAPGYVARLLRFAVVSLYKLALGKTNTCVIFQNPDDLGLFNRYGLLNSSKVEVIRGSGVDISDYAYISEPQGTPVVSFAARMLKDKGVVEFVEAARTLRKRGVDARFQLIGDVDHHNPACISYENIEEWRREGVVEYLGFRNDIPNLFSSSNLVVLPSYREGLPKVLLEAAACGRAVVTTDVPGCRDAITPGVTGLLVPVKNAEALADAIQLLVEDPALRQRMGEAGRKLAETEFTIEHVVEQHMRIYRESLVHA